MKNVAIVKIFSFFIFFFLSGCASTWDAAQNLGSTMMVDTKNWVASATQDENDQALRRASGNVFFHSQKANAKASAAAASHCVWKKSMTETRSGVKVVSIKSLKELPLSMSLSCLDAIAGYTQDKDLKKGGVFYEDYKAFKKALPFIKTELKAAQKG